MIGSLVYGLLVFVAFVVFCRLAPQPIWSLVFWVFAAVHVAVGARTTWIRTRLPFATAAMVFAAIAAALVALSTIRGYVFPLLPIAWAVPVYALIIAAPLCLFMESRVHRREWERWRSYMEHMSALDIVRGRHVPDWREADRR